MKKSVWISLIVSGALIVFGAGFFVSALNGVNWDFSALSGYEFVTDTCNVTEPFSNISIDSDTADIQFIPSTDGKCRVEYGDLVYNVYEIEVRDGTLHIILNDTRKWYDYISIGTFTSSYITVYLPAGEYGTLTVSESTGDIEIPADFSFENLDMELSTGDVNVLASIKNTAKIKANTGDVTLKDLCVGGLEIKVTTGKIELEGVDCTGDVSLRCSTGKTFLTDLTCASLTSKGSSGDILLKNVIALGAFDISRDTGDVSFDSCDAANITVSTDTGDVRGTLRTDKIFVCRSDTGRVEVPPTTKGGTCRITTDTGDIIITIVSE